ncbi:MAG: hypothetical protein ABIO55_01495, partial [Ginsengibacter sp.]
MKAFFLLALTTMIFLSCRNDNNNDIVPNQPVVQDDSVIISPGGYAVSFFHDFQIIDTLSSYIIFPLETGNAKPDDESYKIFSKERGEGSLYWNMVFYNSASGEYHLLAPETKILIKSFTTNGESRAPYFTNSNDEILNENAKLSLKKYIFYEASTT